MKEFLKKLFGIKSTTVQTKKGPVKVETDDPILAEVVAKAWETEDIVIFENGKITTIPNPHKPKDNQ